MFVLVNSWKRSIDITNGVNEARGISDSFVVATVFGILSGWGGSLLFPLEALTRYRTVHNDLWIPSMGFISVIYSTLTLTLFTAGGSSVNQKTSLLSQIISQAFTRLDLFGVPASVLDLIKPLASTLTLSKPFAYTFVILLSVGFALVVDSGLYAYFYVKLNTPKMERKATPVPATSSPRSSRKKKQ